MKCIAVHIYEISPKALKMAQESLLAELKRRRVKSSYAGPLPSSASIAKFIKDGTYTFRYVEAFGWDFYTSPQLIGRLDTIYGKGNKVIAADSNTHPSSK